MGYSGVTFNNLRKALYYLYYGNDFSEEEAYKYIIPMQANFFNPIEDMGKDTYMQFFIERDIRITQDANGYNQNFTRKKAYCSVRFLGENAENWAKAFHHLTKREDTYKIFLGTCQAQMLEFVDDIIPTQVSFDGINTNIAFDVDFRLDYIESIDIDWVPLARVSRASGSIK